MHVDFIGVRAAGNADHPELLHPPLPPQIDAPAGVNPMQQRLGRWRSDVAAEDRSRLVDAPVVTGPAVAGLGDLLLYRLRDLQRAADRAGREDLELDLSASQRLGLL